MGFIRNELLTDDFYLKAASLFLKGSYGMKDRIRATVGLITNIETVGETAFKYLDIWHVDDNGIPDYFEYTGSDPGGTSHYWLELIGSLVGVQRQVAITAPSDNGPSELTTEIITLNNYEYLVYIQATIQKNHISGTREDLRKIYRGTSIDNASQYLSVYENPSQYRINRSYIEGLGIIYQTRDTLACAVILVPSSQSGFGYGVCTDNLEKLFAHGLLTVENLGIQYTYVNSIDFAIGQFDYASFYTQMQCVFWFRIALNPERQTVFGLIKLCY